MGFSKLLDDEVQEFIQKHEQDDPFALSLKYDQVNGVPIQIIAEQIAVRQKAKVKLPHWYQNRQILFPSKISLEQCSSQTAASYKASLVRGKSLVDLTGGLGVDTYYFSKNFEQAVHVEQQTQLSELAAHNFAVLGASNIKTVNSSAEDFLSRTAEGFDVIYLDPARRSSDNRRIFRLEDCSPNVLELQKTLLSKAENVLIKTSPLLDIHLALEVLKGVHEVHVISVNNECKEVLYLINKSYEKESRIITVNIKNSTTQLFRYYKSEEAVSPVFYGDLHTYLYEPNASLLKAGAFKIISKVYEISKLHPNTHLYTSDNLISGFPGRVFQVAHDTSYSRKTVGKLITGKKANITSRNFPDDVATIRKKLKLEDGGDTYLFAFTDMKGAKRIAITYPV